MFNFEFKDGLKVKFTRNGCPAEGAIESHLNGFLIACEDEGHLSPEEVHDLRPAEGFWPVSGDVLENDNNERTVISVVGNVYFISSGCFYSREGLVKAGYKIKGQQETITVEEAEKRLGVRIK